MDSHDLAEIECSEVTEKKATFPRALLKEVHDGLKDTLHSCTVAIYAKYPQGGRRTIAGSGILLRIADEHFLLTAAHVSDGAAKQDIPYYLCERTTNKAIALSEVLVASSKPAKDDLFHWKDDDVAAARLTQDIVKRLSPGCKFLGLSDLDPLPPREPGYYVIYGYPEADLKTNPSDGILEANPLYYGSGLYSGNRGWWKYHKPERDIALDFQMKNISSIDGGSPVPPPLDGMSGCGIWRAFNLRSAQTKWKSDDLRLVGIQHRVEKEIGIVGGTQIRFLLQRIAKAFPTIARSMQIHDGTTWR